MVNTYKKAIGSAALPAIRTATDLIPDVQPAEDIPCRQISWMARLTIKKESVHLNPFGMTGPPFKIVCTVALKIIDHDTQEYLQMVHLRNEILRKPLGLSFAREELDQEKEDILMGAFEDGKLLGCCLLSKLDGNCVRLRQMAVPNNMQGKGIGRALMGFAENIARDLGYKVLIMHARKTAIGFYEKLGYSISGEEFDEVTVSHFAMQKNL